MAAILLKDFADLVRAIRNELKIQEGDTESINRIKQTLNMQYINEIVPHKRWWWLQGSVDVRTIQFLENGTASVTPGSASVTLSVATPLASGSLVGYYFSVNNYDEIYTISAHTANTTAITLSSPFTGTLNATANYKIWTDKLALPTDLRECVEVRHDFMRVPMEGRGYQEFRKLLSSGPKSSGRPSYYNVIDFKDPTPLTDETEADRYRQIQIYPSLLNETVTLHIDYVKEVAALDDDTDEPLMPIEDRVVLYYAALSRLWSILMRNPEEAAINFQLYQAKLARMSGKIEEGFDKPVITPDSFYFRSKRGSRIKNTSAKNFSSFAGGSGSTIPTYAKNITIEGGNFTDDMTADAGVTIDGRDISVDGASLDSHIAANQNVHGIGAGNAVVGTGTTQTLTNKTMDVASNSITSATTSVLAQFNGSGVLSPSTVSATELAYLEDNEGLTTVALNDNQVAAANIATWTVASFNVIQLAYSIVRSAANIESGIINMVSDGTNAAIAQGAVAGLGTIGVTLSADVSAGALRLRYTSTSTGTAPTFKYKLQKWIG